MRGEEERKRGGKWTGNSKREDYVILNVFEFQFFFLFLEFIKMSEVTAYFISCLVVKSSKGLDPTKYRAFLLSGFWAGYIC